MTDIAQLALKDLRLLLRDRAGFFFTFFWPVVMAMFFGSVFGGPSASGPRAIKLMVVDQDRSAASQLLLDELDAAAEIDLIGSDPAAAVDAVRRGEAAAYLVVPPGFGLANSNRFSSGAPRVELRTDPSRFAESGLLEGVLLRTGATLLQRSLADAEQIESMAAAGLGGIETSGEFEGRAELEQFLLGLQALSGSGLNLAIGEGGQAAVPLSPLVVDRAAIDVSSTPPKRPRNPFAVSFAQAMLWAILGCSASFGISIATERTQGTLLRLRTSRLSSTAILGGKAVACFLTSLTVCALLMLLAMVGFGVRPLSWPLLGVALVATTLCFVGVMMLLSVLGRTERAAAGIGWAILLLLSMFGGGMVPLFIMPEWMRALSDFSPVKWGILAVEGAVWRGFSPTEMLLPCGILLAVGTVTFVLGARLFKWGELG